VGGSPNGDQRGVLADPVWAAWRDVPPVYGHWKTVYNRHRRWSRDETWVRILDELRRDADVAEGTEWTVGVDAGVVRAHQHAAGARHHPPADVAVEVVAPVDVDTGGRVESQETSREAQPGVVGAVPGRVDVQDSSSR
jgi:hypothetical protein